MSVFSVICAILVLALCVLLHEAGHFFSALALGIPVEEFSIGFGPKLFQFRFRGVKYSLRLIFLGGYVRYYMDESEALTGGKKAPGYDDEVAPQAPQAQARQTFAERRRERKRVEAEFIANMDSNCYYRQPAWRRLISVFCGPFMNFVLAFVVAVMLYATIGNPVIVPRIAQYSTDSPAYAAGLQPGDIITSVNGEKVPYDAAGADTVEQAISASGGQPLDITVSRAGQSVSLTVTPKYSADNARYMIGISFGNVAAPCTAGEAISRAGKCIVDVTREMYSGLGQLFHSAQPIDQQLTGPVGTVKIISEQVQQGGINALWIILLISLNFGILNLLPIPGLDGSKVVFLIIEMIRRKPIPPMREAVVNMVGLALLFGLMLFVTYNDIARLITG